MKRYIFAALIIASFLFVFSCSRSGSESLPRDGYNTIEEGTLVKRAPDDKSESISIIPFGAKVTLAEKSSSTGDVSWYRIKWNGTDAWINGAAISDIKGFAETAGRSIERDKSYIKEGARELFAIDKTEGIKSFSYTGGEMEPAEMTFLPGGGMILNSKIFSEKYMNYYFTYSFLNDGRLVKITFADSRLNFSDYAEVENGSASVFQIDRNEGSITYHVKNGAFYFMNWGFVSR